MGEARLGQVLEIARAFQLPPVFLQDLSKGTFANTEQQDLFFVKHLIGQWAKRFEQQLNLKLFGQRRTTRKVEHNLDGLMRGDFKARAEAVARLVQGGVYRSEEHTSELQSLMRISYAVLCLKKKKQNKHINRARKRHAEHERNKQ